MNDDLISRKSLIENLNKFAPEHYTALVNDLIMKEPTAFDKEKVIEKLKRLEKDTFDYYNRYNDEMAFGESAAFRSAIEIVEKGGIE